MVSESPTWPLQVQPWPEETGTPSPSPSPAAMNNNRFSAAKRRRVSGSESPVAVCPSPAAASTPGGMMQTHEAMDDTPLSLVQQQQPPPLHQHNNSPTPPNPVLLSHHSLHSDDLDIKPGIAELIREEERVCLLYFGWALFLNSFKLNSWRGTFFFFLVYSPPSCVGIHFGGPRRRIPTLKRRKKKRPL